MANKPKAIVISGADAPYFALAQDLFNSMANHAFQTDFDLGMLDIGLTGEQRAWLAERNIQTVPVQSDIDYPAREVWERDAPSYRTLTARPFLRRYFPGYDTYLWIDADIWVQTPEAIDVMLQSAAKNNAIHLAMEFDRCYPAFFDSARMWGIYHEWYAACYKSDEVNAAMTLKPMLNAGLWALSKDAPLWDAWLQIYRDALQNIPQLNNLTIMTDQLAMNIAVYMKKVPHIILPASYNWLTFFGTPMLDKETGLYIEPAPPYRPISQFHLTQKPKTKLEKISCTDGTTVERPLTYAARNG